MKNGKNGKGGFEDNVEVFEEDDGSDELYNVLDDEQRAQFDEVLGLKVVGLELWEESIGDEEGEDFVPAERREIFDGDLFLEDGTALELYVAQAYPDPDGDPLVGMDNIFNVVGRLADEQLEVVDYQEADEEGGLALAFGKGEQVKLVLVAGAWMISEWEEEGEAPSEA